MSKLITEKDALLAAFPYSLTRDTDKVKLADAVASELIKTVAQSEYAAVFPRIDELPEEVLDILAADFKIQWYEVDAPVWNKRQAVKECMLVHKYKGTKYAVETALRSIYDNAKVVEWNQYNGPPFHFKVYIYDTGSDEEKRKRVLTNVQYYKNVRSVLDETVFIIDINAESGFSVKTLLCGKIKTIRGAILDPRIMGITASAGLNAGTKLGGKVKMIYSEVEQHGNLE